MHPFLFFRGDAVFAGLAGLPVVAVRLVGILRLFVGILSVLVGIILTVLPVLLILLIAALVLLPVLSELLSLFLS